MSENNGNPIARIGDLTLGTCFHPSHDTPLKNVNGKIISGSSNVFSNGKNVARIGDIALSDCGHRGKIISGSSTVNTNEKSTARIGDITTGDYIAKIISGSENVNLT